MAILYPWATKEYVLWEMSLAQIILYLNIGADIKNPKPKGNPESLIDYGDADEVLKKKEELRKLYGAV